MKLLVIGAAGMTGRLVVQKLIARGDEVTAFARTPTAITERSPLLRIAPGDARGAGPRSPPLHGHTLN